MHPIFPQQALQLTLHIYLQSRTLGGWPEPNGLEGVHGFHIRDSITGHLVKGFLLPECFILSKLAHWPHCLQPFH